jgi:hypothetical protein
MNQIIGKISSNEKPRKIISPFTLPEIIQEKVRLSELLEMIRPMVSKKYMPTGRGRAKSSRVPRLVQEANKQFPTFPKVLAADTGHCEYISFTNQEKQTHVFLSIVHPTMMILIDLTTEKAILHVSGSDVGFVWVDGLPLALDRVLLSEELRTYL